MLENKYIVSAKQAQKLKKAGYMQDSQFWYGKNPLVDMEWTLLSRSDKAFYQDHNASWEFMAAPISDELIESLPNKIGRLYVELHLKWMGDNHRFIYMPILATESLKDKDSKKYHPIFDLGDEKDNRDFKTPSSALAELWLWLGEEGHL